MLNIINIYLVGTPGGTITVNPPGGTSIQPVQSVQSVKVRTINRPPKRSTPNEPNQSKVLRLTHPNASDPAANPPGQNGSGTEKIQFGSPNPVTPRFVALKLHFIN